MVIRILHRFFTIYGRLITPCCLLHLYVLAQNIDELASDGCCSTGLVIEVHKGVLSVHLNVDMRHSPKPIIEYFSYLLLGLDFGRQLTKPDGFLVPFLEAIAQSFIKLLPYSRRSSGSEATLAARHRA